MSDADTFRLNAVGIGPQKTASSWLHACLQSHPEVCLPHGVKETFFFDRRFASGMDWYSSHFRCRERPVVCEIAPTYFDSTAARDRIAANNAACRVLVTLRNPVDRAFSSYLHLRKTEGVTSPFEQAMKEHPTILSGSRYGEHLPMWLDAFGRDRVLLLFQEDIQQQPEAVLESVYAFLGIRSIAVPEIAREQVNVRSLPAFPRVARTAGRVADWLRSRRLHGVVETVKPWVSSLVFSGHRGDYPALNPETARSLHDLFAEDVRYVEQLSGRDLTAWSGRTPQARGA